MGHLQTRKNLSKKEKPFQTRKNLSKKEKPFQTRKKHQQTRETPFEQGKRLSINKKNTFQARKRLSSKGYLPIKCKSLQVVGVSRQGKGVVSDGRYGVIGGSRYCLLVWGDAEETKGERGAVVAWSRPRWSSVPVPLWRV